MKWFIVFAIFNSNLLRFLRNRFQSRWHFPTSKNTRLASSYLIFSCLANLLTLNHLQLNGTNNNLKKQGSGMLAQPTGESFINLSIHICLNYKLILVATVLLELGMASWLNLNLHHWSICLLQGNNQMHSSSISIYLIYINFLAAQALQRLSNLGKLNATEGKENPLITLKSKAKIAK